MQAETLLEYSHNLAGPDGHVYRARACGRPRENGTWEGWLEFPSVDASIVRRTSRETTQPNHTDLAYWATGLSRVYIEGALRRALDPPPRRTVTIPDPPAFEGPAPGLRASAAGRETAVVPDAILDPFEVYRSGETPLRNRLEAMAVWHLRNIAGAYGIVVDPDEIELLTKPELIERIVASARASVGLE